MGYRTLPTLLFLVFTFTLSCARSREKGTPSHGHLYPVEIQGKWGFMDSTGTLRIMPSFDDATGFVEDRARVWVNKKAGFIDREGAFVAKPQFDAAGDYGEGLARVKVGNKWGFVRHPGAHGDPTYLRRQRCNDWERRRWVFSRRAHPDAGWNRSNARKVGIY